MYKIFAYVHIIPPKYYAILCENGTLMFSSWVYSWRITS